MKITPDKLTEFRLVKITYDHTPKDFDLFEKTMSDEDAATIMSAHRHASVRVRKRNKMMDWIWAPEGDIESLLETLEGHSMRFKLTDHTQTYYASPEKLSALRSEVDEFIARHADVDFVLDRIGLIGIENISKIEREILSKG